MQAKVLRGEVGPWKIETRLSTGEAAVSDQHHEDVIVRLGVGDQRGESAFYVLSGRAVLDEHIGDRVLT